ncbi:MAG: Holliday junction branch migration protein RuvA [Candidatus Omnitrophota bacterium]|nr:Holliday junction branch migration protein RuvA [Candidatus Omnitrophota bacterium]
MYHYLTGNLVEKSPTAVVIDVGGVGYQVHIPVSTYTALPPLGESVQILTHFLVREDAQALYGFLTDEERSLFRLLISVSGIGPKVAMTALSGIPIAELKRAIVNGALPVLTAIGGVGRKTAERIIVELREKIVLEKHCAGEGAVSVVSADEQLVEDSVQALVSLGYRKPEAKNAIEKALKDPVQAKGSVEDLIRASLKNL